MPDRPIRWSEGTWTHPPAQAVVDGPDLVATAVSGSDAWRVTAYGFVHDSEHALLAPLLPADVAVEVTFTVDLQEQFDQAGLFLKASSTQWVKAGVEYVDGAPHVGVVVTDGRSDWSAFPVPDWVGRRVTIRASRAGDAVTVRARVAGGEFQLVRLLPLDQRVVLATGPYLCSPMRGGFAVRFHSWCQTRPDAALH